MRPVSTRPPVFQVLRDENYRYYFPAVVANQLARSMWLLTSGFLVLRFTDSTFLTQMVGVAATAPLIPVGLIIGAVSDSFDRRRILLFGLVVNTGLALIASALALAGVLATWNILVLTLIMGCAIASDKATRRAFVSDLVPRDHLAHAITLDAFGMTTGMMMGPLLAGTLLDIVPGSRDFNLVFVYALMAACFFIALLFMSRTQPQAAAHPSGLTLRSTFSSLGEGFRVVAGSRAIIGLFGITFLFNLSFPSHQALIPVFAEKVLDVGPTALGALASAGGLGALTGLVFIASRRHIERKSTYYYGGTLTALAFLFVFAVSNTYLVAFAALLLAGAGVSGFNSMHSTLVLLSAPDAVRGRVLGINNIIVGVTPLGLLMVGAVAEFVGPGQAVRGVAAGGLVLTGLWVVFAKQMRQL